MILMLLVMISASSLTNTDSKLLLSQHSCSLLHPVMSLLLQSTVSSLAVLYSLLLLLLLLVRRHVTDIFAAFTA